MTRMPDLRLRLVAAFVLVAATSQLSTPGAAAAMLALAIVMAFVFALDQTLWRRLLHIEGFVALLAIALPFTVPGSPAFTVGPFTASIEGLTRAGLLAMKISASGLFILSLLATAEPDRLGAALRSMRAPEKLVRMLVLTLRYLHLIRDETRRLHEAMRARAFTPRSNRHSWNSYGNLIGMVLLRALERAGRVDEAMRCRGFAGRFPHGVTPSPAARDWFSCALLSGIALTALVVDRT